MDTKDIIIISEAVLLAVLLIVLVAVIVMGNGQVFFSSKPKPTPKPREPSQLERWQARNTKAREQEEERLQAIAAALNEEKRLAEEREREVMELNRLALAAANQNITREVMDGGRNREPQYTGPGVYNATLNWLTGGPTQPSWFAR